MKELQALTRAVAEAAGVSPDRWRWLVTRAVDRAATACIGDVV